MRTALFCSLLNAVAAYDPVGFGIPYSSMLFSNQQHEFLVAISAQVLLCLLDQTCGIESGVDNSRASTSLSPPVEQNHPSLRRLSESSSKSSIPPPSANCFKSFITRIHRSQDLELLLTSFCRLLEVHRHIDSLESNECKKYISTR